MSEAREAAEVQLGEPGNGKIFRKLMNGKSLKVVKKSRPPVDKVGKVVQMTVGEVLSLVEGGDLIDYVHNRGGARDGARIVPSRVKEISEEFDPEALGMLEACPTPDGTKMEMIEGHNRVASMCRRFGLGKMTKGQMKSPLYLRVHPSNKKLYIHVRLGRQKAHTSSNHIMNKELGFGSLVDRVLSFCQPETQKFTKNKTKFLRQIAYIIRAVAEGGLRKKIENWNFLALFSARQRMEKIFCLTPQQLKKQHKITLTDNQAKRIAEAVDWYCEYRTALVEKATQSGVNIKAVLNSGPWFGLLVADKIRPHVRLTRSTKVLSKQTVREIAELSKLLPHITGSTYANIHGTISEIVKVLKTGHRSRV